MKKIVLISAILLSTITVSFGQVTVEGVNINDLDIKYCELIGYNRALFDQNIIVTVDYGQKFNPDKSQLIKGPDDKAIEFNTMIAALNFMEENGWEYVNNNVVSAGNSSIYYYLLKKKE